MDELDAELFAEGLDDLLALALSHQAVVDQHAGELIADRAVDERRRGRRVDSAGEAADDLRLAHLGPDLLDLLLDHGRGRPTLLAADDLAQEPLEHLGAVRGVDDLGVELDAVEAAVGSLEGGDRRARAGREGRRSPSGASITASRWLIQHCCSSGRPRSSLPPSPVSVSVVRPNSPASAPSTLPPSSSAIACMP